VSWWALAVGYLVLFTAPGKLLAVMIGVRILRRGITAGDHPRGGRVHLQLWACEKLVAVFGIRSLAGTPWAARYARALGCDVGKHVDLHSTVPVTGMAELGHGCTVEGGVDMAGWWIDGDVLRVGKIRVGVHARVATRSILLPGADIGAGAEIEAGTRVDGRIAPWEVWAGSPAEFVGLPDRSWPAPIERRSTWWNLVYSFSLFGIGAFPFITGLPGLAFMIFMLHGQTQVQPLLVRLLTWIPAGVGISVLSYVLVTALSVRFFGLGLKAGVHKVDSYAGWCVWMTEALIGGTRAILFPLYAGLITPWWLRLLGAHIGKGVEASTVTGIPKFIYADDKSFLADDTLVAPSELRGGWVRFGPARVGKRAFAGNSGIVAPGRQIHDDSLIAVLSSAPAQSAPGTSWLGRPARSLPRVAEGGSDQSRTFNPKKRLVVARMIVESFRVLPWMVSAVLGLGVLVAMEFAQQTFGWLVAVLFMAPIMFVSGVLAAGITTIAKWLLVGRFKVAQHPLWSSFVWRNELFDVFYEMLGVPWFGATTLGTPIVNMWLRTLGVKIGRSVWLESYWVPETDLVHLGDGVTVNRGCVLQTHLFHDRLMRVDGVRLDAGASLGPNSVILPGASLGARTAIGAASLVMRGEAVPARSRWSGNSLTAEAGASAPFVADSSRTVAMRLVTPRSAKSQKAA